MKHRKLGQGAHRKVDSDEEEFVVKCIEDKATSHGRRHDSVLYLNDRVKVKDFRGTVNYFRVRLGKKLLRSNTTIYNGSRRKRAQKVKMNYWILWMQATQTKMTERTVKVKRKMSCLKETG